MKTKSKKQLKADRIRLLYIQSRDRGNLASYALREAKTRYAWNEKECGEHDTPKCGDVRLKIEADDSPDMSWLEQNNITERERKETFDRANRDGVCGIVGEYYDGEQWQQADSVWGFIGDDWKHSGYDVDVMRETLDAASEIEFCKCCKRPKRKTA